MVAEMARVSTESPRGDNVSSVAPERRGETVSDPGDRFQKAVAAWRGVFKVQHGPPAGGANCTAAIGLSTLVSRLDDTASDVIAHQRESLVQRKDLAQKTKDFRKLDDAAKLAEYKGLLKGMGWTPNLWPLLTWNSLPDIYRSSHTPRKDLVFRLSPAIFRFI